MSAHQNLFYNNRPPRIESPAKIFAKLKLKVQKEAASCSRDRHGGGFTSPGRRCDGDAEENHRAGSYHGLGQPPTLSAISTNILPDPAKENYGYDFYPVDVQSLTLSPISTPEKPSRYQRGEPEDTFALNKSKRLFMSDNTASRRSFLESTAVTHSHRNPFRNPGEIRNPQGAKPKAPSDENRCVWTMSGHDQARADQLQSPSKLVTPVKNRLRKRKCEQSDLGQTKNSETVPLRKRVLTSTSSEDDTQDQAYESDGRGFPAQQMGQEPMIPPPTTKRLQVVMEKVPLMSPAKMFAFMKERENQRMRAQPEAHEVRRSSRNLFSEGKHYQNTPSPVSSPGVAQTEDNGCGMVVETETETQGQVSITQSDAILLEDPVLLNTPRISIPMRQPENKTSRCPEFPSDSVIYLKNWILMKNSRGLFVDGVHKEKNIAWNSNIIVDRVSNSVVKTVTGRIYILVGKMRDKVGEGFPKWFLKKFVSGFPAHWKIYYEKLLTESRDRERKKPEKGKADVLKEKPKVSSEKKKKKRSTTSKTPVPTPPLSSSFSSSATKVSRSGRIIKPPLEYWRGGRVVLDADMNVTVHNCYDSSILLPTTVLKGSSDNVLPPSSEGSDGDESVLLRKTRPPVRKGSQTKLCRDVPVSTTQSVSPAETNTSSGNRIGTSTRASKPLENRLYVDTIPRQRRQSDKTASLGAGKRTNGTRKNPGKYPTQTVPSSPETSFQPSSDEGFIPPAQKKDTGGHRKKKNRPQANSLSPTSDSPESSEKKPRKQKTRNNKEATQPNNKQSKRGKPSPPTKSPIKSAGSKKKQKPHKQAVCEEQSEDSWTEAELQRLREAVAYYPRHLSGYWAKVAKVVGRSAEECHNKHTPPEKSQTPEKKSKKSIKEKKKTTKEKETCVISAKVGTIRRKQQVRNFLEAMPKDDADDAFSSAYMNTKRVKVPSICMSEKNEITVKDFEPLTPTSRFFSDAKTPQCLHITPKMMGSSDWAKDDKYVYHLQKRTKKSRFTVGKQSSKRTSPMPSLKQKMSRCANTENENFAVWEMFPGQDDISDSEEEQDYYFSEAD